MKIFRWLSPGILIGMAIVMAKDCAKESRRSRFDHMPSAFGMDDARPPVVAPPPPAPRPGPPDETGWASKLNAIDAQERFSVICPGLTPETLLKFEMNLMNDAAAEIGFRRGLVAAKMYCSRDWDEALIGRAHEFLKQRKLLLADLVEPQFRKITLDSYEGIQDAGFRRFIETMEGLQFLVTDKVVELGQARSPTDKDKSDFDREVGFDSPCCKPSARPVMTMISETPPVRLITCAGRDETIRLAGRAYLSWVNATGYKKAILQVGVESMGLSMLEGKTAWRRVYCMSMPVLLIRYWTTQTITLADAAKPGEVVGAKGAARKATHPPLTIIETDESPSGQNTGGVRHRSGWYDRATGVMWVKYQKADYEGAGSSPGVLAHSTFEHELHHYLYQDAEADQCPFLAEAAATYYGERSRRNIIAAASLGRDDPAVLDRVAELFRRLTDPTTKEKAMAQLAAIQEEALRAAPLTANQQSFLEELRKSPPTGAELEMFAGYSPTAFHAAKDPSRAYALAWGSYQAVESAPAVLEAWHATVLAVNALIAAGKPATEELRSAMERHAAAMKTWLASVK